MLHGVFSKEVTGYFLGLSAALLLPFFFPLALSGPQKLLNSQISAPKS